jgi:hypothetical protein
MERPFPLISDEVLRQRRARVQDVDLSSHYIRVPLSLLAWVGHQRHVDRWRWVCQAQHGDMTRECNTVGDADSEQQAIVDLAEHLAAKHGAMRPSTDLTKES